MKLKCLIVDDEPVARKVLQEFIEDIDWLELAGEAENPMKAMKLLQEQEIDILFLDINMPKINGIDFLKSTPTDACVIITTAYAEYAVESYGLDVLDYLVKPIAADRLLKACNKAKEWRELRSERGLGQGKRQGRGSEQGQVRGQGRGSGQVRGQGQGGERGDHFFVKSNNQIEKVYYDDLVYAEAMLNYVMLYTTAKKMMVYVTIKSLEEQLPVDIFIKVHKSFIVNMNKIRSIEGNILDMGIEKITISQSLREKVINEIVKDKMIRR
jgi:DNA-binding LytR/AlgR family response regulator